MKQTTRLILGVAAGSCLVLAVGSAQFPSQRPTVSPYTGVPAAPAAANPFTGKPGAQPGAANPLTGRTAPPPAGYNPLTGKTQPGLKTPAPTQDGQEAWPSDPVPTTGKAGDGLEFLDKAVLQIMDRHGIPGAALAVAKNGKLIYARGFGWADLARQTPVDPQTSFSLASLSKPITALAVLLLVERGKMSLDDRVLDHLKHIKPVPGARIDPRLRKVTVRQLLNHTGGWDRSVSGDPVTWSPQIARVLRVRLPISNEQFISFMMGVRLDFDPGTKHVYSNVGCMLLDEIIEKVSGQRYEEFVRRNVLQPMGGEKIFLSTARQGYREGEARGYLAGTGTQVPPMSLPMARAAAGWCASPVDMVRFLTALDGSRVKKVLKDETFESMVAPPPPPLKKNQNGTYPGLGWPIVGPSGKGYGYVHDGNWPGTRAFMKCNASKGLNWALLFNVSMHPDPIDQGIVTEAARALQETLESTERFPDLDLFADYR
jgi:CubicO group peptidase (beta-lactamase class C family)